MKKLIIFLMILAFGAALQVQAAKPIPSHKVKIAVGANFQEKKHNGYAPGGEDLKGKRNMIIVANVVGPAKTPIYIWVYSLDMRDIQGPFVIYGDGEISVPIDDRDWGVLVQCEDKATVSVYSDDTGGEGIGGDPNL